MTQLLPPPLPHQVLQVLLQALLLPWLGEQVEIVEESTDSFQVLATILGSFAILLTWLIVV